MVMAFGWQVYRGGVGLWSSNWNRRSVLGWSGVFFGVKEKRQLGYED